MLCVRGNRAKVRLWVSDGSGQAYVGNDNSCHHSAGVVSSVLRCVPSLCSGGHSAAGKKGKGGETGRDISYTVVVARTTVVILYSVRYAVDS